MRSEKKEFIITEEEIKILKARRRRMKRRNQKVTAFKTHLKNVTKYIVNNVRQHHIFALGIMFFAYILFLSNFKSPDNGEINFACLLLAGLGVFLFINPGKAFSFDN